MDKIGKIAQLEAAILLERAQLNDLDYLLVIENKLAPFPWTKQHFQEELHKPYSQILVAKEPQGAVLGYVVYWRIFDEGQILNIAVDANVQRQGIGQKLINHVVESCRQKKIKKIVLDVRVNNHQAISFYLKNGFYKEQCRENFYTDAMSAYQMVRYIYE